MTHALQPTDREAEALRLYADCPLDDGDAVLLLDGTTCLELEGLADRWDDLGRRRLVEVLSTSAGRVLLAIARPRAELHAGDHALWRALHADLRDTGVELLPVRALPAG